MLWGQGPVRQSKKGKECSERCLRTRGLVVMDQDFEGTVEGFRKGGRNWEGRRWAQGTWPLPEVCSPWATVAMPSWASRGHPMHGVRTQGLTTQAGGA